MKVIRQTYHIKAPIKTVWQALVDPKVIEKWSGSKAVMNDKMGSKFSLWSGDMYGTNTEVIKEKKLVQDWYGGKWEKPSKVVFTLTEKNGVTSLKVGHWDFPEGEMEDFADGWKRYYCGAIKDYLEN